MKPHIDDHGLGAKSLSHVTQLGSLVDVRGVDADTMIREPPAGRHSRAAKPDDGDFARQPLRRDQRSFSVASARSAQKIPRM